ncbi:peptidase [Candidatus Nitrosotenuis sp. DW1]|uniref:peptidase n=1 Tax=Candidatus Nitrosotenuis sp. DW1 TaxID=2259672 RepID=UPI0015CEAC11|nr:peptidase [Candidatus Nitrosotenuis sp. DW1]
MNSKRILAAVFVTLLLSQMFSIAQFNAYGDGLTQENLPPASFGDRQAALFIKISPPILTKDTIGDTYVQLRLFDAKTNESVPHTSYFISVWKDDKLLLRNLFHAHYGELTLKIVPTKVDVNNVVIYGDEVPQIPGAWTGFNDRVDVHAPVLLDSGLYHFEIKIFGIDYDQNIFAESNVKTFNSWLSVGDISNQKITYNGKSYDASIISYYDKINNFKFDETKKSISFSMPFNWDAKRIGDQPIFVHQEVRVPKAFKEFTDTTAYDGRVSGVPTVGRMLILDPYSIEGTSILHFLINKEDILKIAKTLPAGTKTMEFTVAPMSTVAKNTFDVKLNSGATAKISYDANLGAGDTIPLQISFFDPNGALLKFVRHGFRIEDSSGKVLIENYGNDPQKPGILSSEGIDIQEFKFPSQGNYKLTLGIFDHGLDELTTYQGIGSSTFMIGKSGQSQPIPDYQIPSWIKNNAKWWAEGTIGDSDFVQGIQYLIKQGIMKIPDAQSGSGTSQTIPSWIKNNAKWWAEGTIGDSDFVQGIQYLITQGIIKV